MYSVLSTRYAADPQPLQHPELDTFLGVGHCLVGLMLAYAGGLAGQVIYVTRPKPNP